MRVLNRIARIPLDPRGRGSNKLSNYVAVWAVRVGDYRIAYTIDDVTAEVRIAAVGHRRDFYRRLRRIPHLR